MSFNIDLLLARSREIKEALASLEQYSRISKDEFLSRPESIDAAKYRLLLAIESSISLCNHISSRLGGQTPESFGDCFLTLWKNGVISEELARRMASMSRFRNMLIHRYWKIDDSRVYDIILHDLGDLAEYLRQLGSYIKVKL